ncbi:hypothetical protein N9850_03705 [Granulosicoccus sp.]|nr:hypothetical protein [Granulosicoccus sp.]MDB4222853.1 hypothetical protein [Granulosicoccus sp.]
MNKRTVVLLSATWMLLTLIFSSAAVGVQSRNAQLLITLSGFDDQLAILPDAVNSSFNTLMLVDGVVAPFETNDIPQLKSAVSSVFKSQTLRDSVLNELEASLSEDEMATLIQFFSSKAGTSLRRSELENSVLEHADRFHQWYQETGMYGLDHVRQRAIHDLERAMQATLGAVDAMIGMQVAMQVSLSPVLPANERLSPSELLLVAQEQRPELTRVYRQSSLETLAFVFQEQSTDAISAYAAVLKTNAGQRYVTALNEGMTRGLFSAAEQLGMSIQEILKGRLGQGA